MISLQANQSFQCSGSTQLTLQDWYFRKLQILFFVLVSSGFSEMTAQRLYHIVQLNGGAIIQDPAALYVGKLDYMPTYSMSDGSIRIGAQLGLFQRKKNADLSFGANASVRLHKFQTLDDNLTLASVYLRPSYEWTTDAEHIFSSALVFELSQINFNVTYHRETHFGQNWWTYGFGLRFSKPQRDPFE